MKLKILLINPWIYDFAAYDLWNMPLGLLYIASFLRRNGADVFFLDCLDPCHPDMSAGTGPLRLPKRKQSGAGSYAKARIPKPEVLKGFPRNYNRYGITPEIFLRSLNSMSRPDLVMVTSMMTYWYPGVWAAIELVRTAFPGAPVVLGGNYVTLCPQHALGSGADFCLAGPAETSLPPLFKDLYNRDMPFIPDADLDSHPYPAFDLILQREQIPVLTSRGCPYRCSYCASHLLNDRFRRRDPIRIADEIEFWQQRLGVRNFSFYDDALLVDPAELAIPLLREIVRRKLPIQFHCPNGLHLRNISPELASLMFQAGFKTLRFGFETSDVARQAATGGKVSNEGLAEAIACLKRAGYQDREIGIYLLCGLPGQTAEEVKESVRFVQSFGARPILAEYSPIPGTGLWAEAVASSPYPIAEEPLFQNNSLLPCRNDRLTYDMYQSLKLMTRIPADRDISAYFSCSPAPKQLI
ncbi:MAG: B12-binding domain-containing radical SAM protein [Proteobacteria bacterium]|nr:B12-binding domain-containing radical SAM protein [Pseudomonadota bacterium]